MVVFADTSALVKRYVPEVGSAWMEQWFDPANGHLVIISEITIVELVSALARRHREASIPSADFLHLRSDFLLHADHEYLVMTLQSTLLIRAQQLVTTRPLRTLDAIQLASALECAQVLGTQPLLLSADRNLLNIAILEGLVIDDPHAHP
jgi:uncharacterized protein